MIPTENLPQPLTPYPEVDAVLSILLTDVRSILGDRLVGMYLSGSLACGDFDPQTSDIDFVTVTTGELPGEVVSALESMHANITISGLKFARKLEGSYITQAALRRYDPQDGPFPCVNEGSFYLAHHESHWVLNLQMLRQCGIVLAGPHPETLIDPVSLADIRQVVQDFLREWWLPMLQHPTRLDSLEYQAYTVLTMCRALYTLECGAIASKQVAACWMLEASDGRWSPLIRWALVWYTAPQVDHKVEALDLISYVLEHSTVI